MIVIDIFINWNIVCKKIDKLKYLFEVFIFNVSLDSLMFVFCVESIKIMLNKKVIWNVFFIFLNMIYYMI